ncbi:hypothetical protein E6H33_10235 [Candidatus Bathyarchaeota archaeon]|nr:MAG: hypothetical protein E6H33_10235 [Candidatus Bathyarchaeota archaeon]
MSSTRLVTDTNRNVLFTDNYQPYGQDNQSTGSETYKFTGKPDRQMTGLYSSTLSKGLDIILAPFLRL